MPWQFLADNIPHVTALLNVTAAVLLVLGFLNIRKGKARVHKKYMLWAFSVSALFLLLYVFHKVTLYQATGEPNRHFPTDPDVASATARYVYFGLLGTHLMLAMLVPFLAVRAIYLASQGRIIAHKKIVKYTYPIWMYVSVTGVLVYLMLYQLYPTVS